MTRGGAGLLTLMILFSFWVNSGPRAGAAPAGNMAASTETAATQSQPRKDRQNPPPPRVADDDLPKYSEELVDTLKAFYLDKSTGEPAKGCPPPQIVEPFLKQIQTETPEVMLAIVPDPVHTHLSLFFDRQIDAIEQAAQDRGYYFDRAIMPWDSKEHLESTDFHLRFEEEREQSGSFLNFRAGDCKSRLASRTRRPLCAPSRNAGRI